MSTIQDNLQSSRGKNPCLPYRTIYKASRANTSVQVHRTNWNGARASTQVHPAEQSTRQLELLSMSTLQDKLRQGVLVLSCLENCTERRSLDTFGTFMLFFLLFTANKTFSFV
jgi:hypothetical protein